MKLKLISNAELEILIKEAKEFIKQTGMFHSAESTAVIAVAECMANEKGLTLYVHRVSE